MGDRLTLGPVSGSARLQTAFGTPTVQFDQQQRGYFIYRLAITGTANTYARIFVGADLSESGYRAVSYFGRMDDADFPPGLFVPLGVQLFVAWYTTDNAVSAGASLQNPLPFTVTAAALSSFTGTAEIEDEQPHGGVPYVYDNRGLSAPGVGRRPLAGRF